MLPSDGGAHIITSHVTERGVRKFQEGGDVYTTGKDVLTFCQGNSE